MDWEKIAGAEPEEEEEEEEEKPAPIKINVQSLLSRVRKPGKKSGNKVSLRIQKNGKFFFYHLLFIFAKYPFFSYN